MDCNLRPYQEEVVQAALRGENSIIWMPTGGGKTRAAVYVTKKHLETTVNAKVAVLVNKVHLVDQHFAKEFKPYLGSTYKITAISGDSNEKDLFGCLVKASDLVICTAQILENALINMEEEKHVELTDFTLLVIDECHHTQKESVYNKIMGRYVEKKVRKEGNLPQILGLTASPGTGGNKQLDKAVEHVLQVCLNVHIKTCLIKESKQHNNRKQTEAFKLIEENRKQTEAFKLIEENRKQTEAFKLIEENRKQTEALKLRSNEQKETIKHFRKGILNLLISTSVAEEGLDIPECNLVVRYGLLTNEIAQQQASGRARAMNSVYSVVAEEGGREIRRELTNEYLESLTAKAIDQVQQMSPREFRLKISELQQITVMSRIQAEKKKDEREQRYSPGQVQFQCRGCFLPVCSGEDLRKIENTHHAILKAQETFAVNWWVFVKCEPKSSQLKEPKT
uniref:Probable ATP-dependent RNA helicase DHX58 n=1 Tax=Sinocyclocheilus grahami TaxID=75366 RepID=A0A672RCR3_SINGR